VLTDLRPDGVQVSGGGQRLFRFDSDGGVSLWAAFSSRAAGDTPIEAAIPALSDTLRVEYLAYAEKIPSFSAVPDPDGWLRLRLSERPVFIREVGEPSRPDLVVDSVWLEPAQPEVGRDLTIRAAVRNIGNRATPRGFGTTAEFRVEGEPVGTDVAAGSIPAGASSEFVFTIDRVPLGMRGPVLYTVNVNPGQRCVELDMSNNAGYAYAVTGP
jgi:hypothetical protein